MGRVAKWSKKYQEAFESQTDLRSACRGLDLLAEEVLKLKKDVQSIPSERKGKQIKLRELQGEEAELGNAKKTTEDAYKKTQEKLDEMKRTLSVSLTSQEQKRYEMETEKENKRSQTENAEIIRKAEAQLRDLIPRSVSH